MLTEAEHRVEVVNGTTTTTDKTTTYTYDLAGNRKTMKDGTDGYAYYYDRFERLQTVKKGASSADISTYKDNQAYTYDVLGRTESETNYYYSGSTKKTGSVRNYNYYASGQLGDLETLYYNSSEGIDSSVDDYYYYDSKGQRVRKVTTSDVTKYYYTGSSVLFTLDEDNRKTSENIISTNREIIAGKRFTGSEYANKWYFYDYDMRGSVSAVLDRDGAYTSGYLYDAFGNTTSRGDSNFLNEMAFTGCIADKSSGLYYMNARYYNPKTGRFLTQDAMGGDKWTNNLYAYCGNNPVGFKDPTGNNADAGGSGTGTTVTTPPNTTQPDNWYTTYWSGLANGGGNTASGAPGQIGNNGGVTQTSGTTDDFLSPDDITRTEDGGFLTADDAALYFCLLNQLKSQIDNKEYGAVIYLSGGYYYLGSTHIGSNRNVLSMGIEATYKSLPNILYNHKHVVGTVHTHTEAHSSTAGGSTENWACGFSGAVDSDFMGLADNVLPGVRYLGAPNGVLYKSISGDPYNEIVYKYLPAVANCPVDNNYISPNH